MATPGKRGKMLILAYSDSEKAEHGGIDDAKGKFEALINPESYTLDYKLKFSDSGQGQGTSGKQLKYEFTEPAEMSFEFLFDNTGIIDDTPRDSVAGDIKEFTDLLVAYQGSSHEPWHFKLMWGENSIFKGRATSVSITYKLFRSDGTPIRAVAKVTFKSSIEDGKRAAQNGNQSPDLTHAYRVKLGDTLPQLCFDTYGDPSYYLQVAAANGLTNFRQLVPGVTLKFPPIAKAGSTP
jgi:phage tail protein X